MTHSHGEKNSNCFLSFVIDVKRGEINNKNKYQNKWDKDKGSITSGGESSQGEKINIPFFIVANVSKGGR
jgi:hypothetical protein